MYGIILAPMRALLGNIIIYALGMGLLIDELEYLLIKGKTHKDNYSKKKSLSLLGLFIILSYIFKKQLLFWN